MNMSGIAAQKGGFSVVARRGEAITGSKPENPAVPEENEYKKERGGRGLFLQLRNVIQCVRNNDAPERN